MTTLRTPVFAANWKMYKGPAATREFFAAFAALHPVGDDRTLIFFPPAISLHAAAEALRGRSDLTLGVQNIHWEPEGAYTGEISAPMAYEAGAGFTLAGHSERRHGAGESDGDVARKAAAALAASLVPVVCVGETLDERRAGRLEEVLARQLAAVLDRLGSPEQIARIMIAYEPVWAIGTGVNATPDDAATAHGFLRRLIGERLNQQAASIPILYGGSVKPANTADLLAAADVDGVLVGGASLNPEDFARIAGVDT
jgi:triosephosphate isomerase (TIM)